MEKRSRRRTRDLVTQAASQGLSQNEIGCARISMMARSTNAPCKGRIQMRKTNPLHFFTFGLQRTAGPYKCAISGCEQLQQGSPLFDYFLRGDEQERGYSKPERLGGFQVDDQLEFGRLIDRQVGRLRALENPRRLNARPAIGIREAASVAHEAIGPNHLTTGKRWNCMLRCQRDDLFAQDSQRTDRCRRGARQRDFAPLP